MLFPATGLDEGMQGGSLEGEEDWVREGQGTPRV